MNLLILFVTIFIVHHVHGYGRIIPNGIVYREVNSNITIVCTIDLDDPQSEGLSSSYLSFQLSNPHQHEDVKIIHESSIELTIPNAQPQELKVTCLLNNTSAVDVVTVFVGYKPKPVINFKCISYNWQNMKCTFERPLNNPIASRYDLTYSIDNKSDQFNRCMLDGDYNRTYWCFLTFSSVKSMYRQNYAYYYFRLKSTNDLGELIENFIIDHFSSVLPNPVERLSAKNITLNSAVIKWEIPYQLLTFPRSLIHRIDYKPEFSNSEWKQLYTTSTEQLKNQIELKDLEFANTLYDVRVSLKVQNASYDMWSPFKSATFRTLSSIADEQSKEDL